MEATKQKGNAKTYFCILCYIDVGGLQAARCILRLAAMAQKDTGRQCQLLVAGHIDPLIQLALTFARLQGVLVQSLKTDSGSAEKAYKAMAAQASGEYYIFTQTSERIYADTLQRLAQAAQNGDCVYTDEKTIKTDGSAENLHKPDFSPDTLLSCDYIGSLFMAKADSYKEVGGIDTSFGAGAMILLKLRLARLAPFVHIGEICVLSKQTDLPRTDTQELLRARKAYIDECGIKAEVCAITNAEGCFHIKYEIEPASVCIIIQSHDHASELTSCLESIFAHTKENIEVLLVENGSTDPEVFAIYDKYTKEGRVRILNWDKPWSYAAINNFAAQNTNATELLLLNNDTRVLDDKWILEMLRFSQREDVGAVGAKLLYPDGTIQHAGVITGICGAARHAFAEQADGEGYMHRLQIAQNLSAVTAACLMIKRELYLKIGGMDENLAVGNNDVDMCMTLRKLGYLNIFTPFCLLEHDESASRTNEGAQHERAVREDEYLAKKWQKELSVSDPYYSAAFLNTDANFTEKSEPV